MGSSALGSEKELLQAMPTVQPQKPEILSGDTGADPISTTEEDGSSSPEESAESSRECGICLEAGACLPPLACGHAFCQSCLIEHLERQLHQGRLAWCPCCRQGLQEEDLLGSCSDELFQKLTEVPPTEAPPETSFRIARGGAADRAFRRAARRLHMKRCPGCNAAIEKTGGCSHMHCSSCGHNFNWQDAETVVPCNRVHFRDEGDQKFFPLWGCTCRNCTPLATAQLIALRAGIITVAIPAATVGVTIAAATVLVPAVVCAPLAVAYEPVRRLQSKPKRRNNIFVSGMRGGLVAVSVAAYLLCADSDDD